MTQPERSTAQLLADELALLGRRDLSADGRAQVMARLKDAIDQGFTARSEEAAAAFMSIDFDDWPEQLSATLFNEVLADVARLPKGPLTENQDRLRRTHLAFLPSQSWSAMTVPAGDSYLIAIDQEVLSALYFLAKLMIVGWTVQFGNDDADAELHRVGGEIPAGVLIRLARCYFGSSQLYGSFILPTVIWNTQSQLKVAASVTFHAERFLLHHEAQHVTLGHLDPEAQAVAPTTLDVGVRQEIEADAGAVAATMARFVNHELDEEEQFEVQTALCGMRLLFEAQDLVERSHFLVRPPSHPSPQARYEVLKEVALRAWVPAEILKVADELTSTLTEICAECRASGPRPRHPESLRDVLQMYPQFPPDDNAAHWQVVDDIEETLRVLDLSIPQHLAELARGVGAPAFADQLQIIQLSVESQTREKYEEHLDDPDFMAVMDRFGDSEVTDPKARWRGMAELTFDSTWGARILPRVLGPAIKKTQEAVNNHCGLSFDQLASWIGSSVPKEAVLPGVALLRRILRDPDAETIIYTIATGDLTGMEHRLMIAADRDSPASFVPDWAYHPGPLGRRAHLLVNDLVPAAADLLQTWLLEADEAIWRFSADGGTAFSELYGRARAAASRGVEQGDEQGSDTVTAYLRMLALAKPRHARFCEATRQDRAAFRHMYDLLPALSILADAERVVQLALHLGTKVAERGWFHDLNRVAEFLEASPDRFHEAGAQVRALSAAEHQQGGIS
jgi:hypothetical protein